MVNTKRSLVEPDRTPLQKQATTLIVYTFPPEPRSRGATKRSSAAKPKSSSPRPASRQNSLQRDSGSPHSPPTRCTSPILEGSTVAAGHSQQQLPPHELPHLDSLDPDLDLGDLLIDEEDDQLPGIHSDMANPATAGATAARAAPGGAQDCYSMPSGAFLSQQLSAQLSGRASTPAPMEQPAQQQLQQEVASQTVQHPEVTVGTADMPPPACNDTTFSPVCDGTAYIVESATTIPGHSATAATATASPAAACGAATAAGVGGFKPTSDVSESLLEVENWLDGLSVDAMLKEQGMLELQQQQPYMHVAAMKGLPNASAEVNVLNTAAAATGGAQAPSLLQHQQQGQGYQQQYDQYVQQYLPTAPSSGLQLPAHHQPEALTPFTTAVAAAAGVPEGWQQQQPLLQLELAASVSMHMDSYNSSNAPAGLLSPDQLQSAAAMPLDLQQQQQQFGDGVDNSPLPMSFQALLMDESATASAAAAVVTTDMHQHNHQAHPQHALYHPGQQQQQQQFEDLDSTPASNYRLLQQHQQQRRQQQQQLQLSQLHTVYSAPAHAPRPSSAAAGGLAAARSLPHSLQTTLTPAAAAGCGDCSSGGVLAPAYSQPVPPVSKVNSTYPAPTTMHSSHTVTTTTAGTQYHTNAPPPGPMHAASGHSLEMRMHNAPMHHQQPPQQQLSASQQELLALKQQLAEEKRRRKEKKKLRRMQKLLLEQQQQQGQLQSQGSGMSQQVLLAAAQQQRPGSSYPPHHTPPHRPGRAGTASLHGQRSATPQHGGLAQQRDWPQGPQAGSGSSNAFRQGVSEVATPPRGSRDSRDVAAASPHAWQHRNGCSSSPHATAAAGFPLDSASAARQHAVAQSLRQLANKSNQQQQYRSAAGTSYPSIGQTSAASRHSPTPPLQGVSSSNTGYNPYTPSHHSSLAMRHSQSHPAHSHSLTQEPLGGTPGDSAVGPTLDGTRSVSLPDQVRTLCGTRGDQVDPSSSQAQARLSGNSSEQGTARAVSNSNTGFSRPASKGVLAGVPVVLDLGDKDPDSQVGGVMPAAPAKASGGFELGAAQRDSRDTPPSGYNSSAATFTHQASPRQHSSAAVDMQLASTAGGASPLSNSSSGRKRSFEQAMPLQQQGSGYAGGSPTSPAVELQVMPYGAHHDGATADGFEQCTFMTPPAQQQQQQQQQPTDRSSQRQARLLQLPFTGADLADRREKERERTPQCLAHDSAAAPPQQTHTAVKSEPQGASPPASAPPSRYPAAANDEFECCTRQVRSSEARQFQQHHAPMHVSNAGWTEGTVMPEHNALSPMQLPRSSLHPSKRSAIDSSMPPPAPHTAATAGLASPVRGLSSAAIDAAADCMSPGSGGGYFGGDGAGGFSGGSSALLGGGNIYRTTSGRVLRMVTHPVTGKPLLLGPAVDAKSSRLGNTSLGAPAPQLFGVEVQTTGNNHAGAGQGSGIGTMSGVSGGASLGSPGSSTSRVRRQSSVGSKPRRRASAAGTGAGVAVVDGSSAMVLSPNSMVGLGALGVESNAGPYGAAFAGQGVSVGVSSAMQQMPSAADLTSAEAGVPQGFEVVHHGMPQGLQLEHAAPAPAGTEIAVDLMSYHGLLDSQGFVMPSNLGSSGVEGWGAGAWGACSNAPEQAPVMYEISGMIDM